MTQGVSPLKIGSVTRGPIKTPPFKKKETTNLLSVKGQCQQRHRRMVGEECCAKCQVLFHRGVHVTTLVVRLYLKN